MNSLRQLGLALHNFEVDKGYLPAASGDQELVDISMADPAQPFSAVVLLLPYIEQDELWDEIIQPMSVGGKSFEPLPELSDTDYPAWQRELEFLFCPSAARKTTVHGETNYAFCVGDAAIDLMKPTKNRGAMAAGLRVTFDSISDGLSNTLLMAEMNTSAGRLANAQVVEDHSLAALKNPQDCFKWSKPEGRELIAEAKFTLPGRGSHWARATPRDSFFNTVLPPNSPSVAVAADGNSGFFSVGAMHAGGVNALRADSSCTFISEDIDAGDLSQAVLTREQLKSDSPIPSRFGVWGAMGTAATGSTEEDGN